MKPLAVGETVPSGLMSIPKRESPSGAASMEGWSRQFDVANPLKSLPTFITICLAGYGGDAIADCPVGYPQGFPCISGGTFISVPSPAAEPVVANEFYVFRYDQAARALFGSVLNEASNAAWVVQTQSEAEEPGGLRYRALMRKSEQAVSISVVSKPEGSYLVVVKRLPK